MDVEKAFISRIIHDRAIGEALKRSITEEFFVDSEHRLAFRWVSEQYTRYGSKPTVELFGVHCYQVLPTEAVDSFESLLNEMRKRRIINKLNDGLVKVVEAGKEDAHKALKRLQDLAYGTTMEVTDVTDMDMMQGGNSVIEAYERLREHKGLLGIPWPWETMNEITKGIRKGQFISIYGPPGTMKTWLLLAIGEHIQRMSKKRCIFFTYEMPKEDILCRFSAYRAGVDYDRFQNGNLSADEEIRLYDVAQCRDTVPFIVCHAGEDTKGGVMAIRAKIEEHKADIALVDGLSFVTQDLGWEAFGTMVKELRYVAMNTGVPIIATHHANRTRKQNNKDSNDATDVALGDTLQRYVDVLIRIIREEIHEEEDELILSVRKVREGKRGNLTINAKPAVDFSQKERRVEFEDDGGFSGGIL